MLVAQLAAGERADPGERSPDQGECPGDRGRPKADGAFPASGRCSPARSSRPWRIPEPSSPAGTSLPGSASCRGRTPAVARSASAASPSKATAICGSCWSSARWPSSATPSGTAPAGRGWCSCWRDERQRSRAVALANKTARMVWAIMTSGEAYREPDRAGRLEIRRNRADRAWEGQTRM